MPGTKDSLFFGIFKFNVHGSLQARVLQFDFAGQVIRNIKQNKIKRSFTFDELVSVSETELNGHTGIQLLFRNYPHPYVIYFHTQQELETFYDVVVQIQSKNFSLAAIDKQVHKEGYLDKQGSSKVWKKRYVVLEEGRVLIYTNKKSSYPLNVVALFGLTIKTDGSRVISLCSPHRNYRLRASDKPTRDMWYTMFRQSSGHRPVAAHNPNKVVYGHPLGSLLSRPEYMESGVTAIPAHLLQCSQYLIDNSLDEEGIFRISGIKDDILRCARQLDMGETIDIVKGSRGSCHTIAGIFTLYFRDLPQPLIPFSLYKLFIAVVLKPPAERPKLLKLCLGKLPIYRRRVLVFLLRLMHKISEKSSVNKMTPSNIAIVFRSCILRNEGAPAMEQFQLAIKCIALMVETGVSNLFPDDDPALSLVRADNEPSPRAQDEGATFTPSSSNSPAPSSTNTTTSRPTSTTTTQSPPPKLVAPPMLGSAPPPLSSKPPPLSSLSARPPVPVYRPPVNSHTGGSSDEEDDEVPPAPDEDGIPPPGDYDIPEDDEAPPPPDDDEELLMPPDDFIPPPTFDELPPPPLELSDEEGEDDIGEDAEPDDPEEEEEDSWWTVLPKVVGTFGAPGAIKTLPKSLGSCVAVPLPPSKPLEILTALHNYRQPIPGIVASPEKIAAAGGLDSIPVLQPWVPSHPTQPQARVTRKRIHKRVPNKGRSRRY